MSESVNWIPVGIFTFSAGLQLGAAVYDCWKKRRDARHEETDYEKVQKGALIQGWKTAVSRDRIGKKHNLGVQFCLLPPWRRRTDPDSSIDHELSLLMWLGHIMPDGRILNVLRRYSLIADVDSTIIRLVRSGGDWRRSISCYLTDRLVAVVFRRRIDFNQFRLVIVDTIAKTSRILMVQSPLISADGVDVHHLLLSKNGLKVVFSSMMFAENDVGEMNEFKRVFCSATYEIPASGAGLGLESINASSAEEIVIPARNGNDRIWSLAWGFPPIAVMYNELAPDAIDSHLVVSYDEAGDWRVTTFADWWASFSSTSIGWRFLSAVDAFASLSPPVSEITCNIPQLKYVGGTPRQGVCGYENGNTAYFSSFTDGTLQRSIAPRSLKCLAAAAVCKAMPNLKVSQLKSLVGFDVFDGMTDTDEEKAPINL